MTRIEPVPAAERAKAIQFIAEGPMAGLADDAHLEGLRSLAGGDRRQRVWVWWAWREQCVAAAMVVEHPGGTGFLLHCPPDAPGVERGALVELVRAISEDSLKVDLYFVQVALAPEDRTCIETVRAGGYEFIAELVYMKLDLPRPSRPRRPRDLRLESYGQFTEQQLGELIADTYKDSLDCPLLLRARPIAGIIDGHKATGVFHPQSWWIAYRDGHPAGCILVNDRPEERKGEVVYVGVHPRHRGRGLGRWLLRHAISDGRRRGLRSFSLAVDGRNEHAGRIYARCGFRETHRREVYAAIAARFE